MNIFNVEHFLVKNLIPLQKSELSIGFVTASFTVEVLNCMELYFVTGIVFDTRKAKEFGKHAGVHIFRPFMTLIIRIFL